MAKKSKSGAMKLPKRLLGVKLPKASRKSLNRILKRASPVDANPLVAGAVGSFITLLAERLEQPLKDLVAGTSNPRKRAAPASAAKH